MSAHERSRRGRLDIGSGRLARSTVALVVLALVVGLLVAPFAWDAAAGPTEEVAVIPLAGVIDGANAADVTERLAEARDDPTVEAVVIVVDSPGGLATASEELHSQVSRTAEVMPVVAVIQSGGLSGGYYAITPSDEIYVKPTSLAGSVGSQVQAPQPVGPLDEVITSGPDKLDGQDREGWERQTQMSGKMFVENVYQDRGDRLELTREELAHAQVYGGISAVEYGLADDVGDLERGLDTAADRAGLGDDYAVTTLQYETEVTFISQSTYLSADVPQGELVEVSEFIDGERDDAVPPVLMLPPEAFADGEGLDDDLEPADDPDRNGGDDDAG
jgi:protease-4